MKNIIKSISCLALLSGSMSAMELNGQNVKFSDINIVKKKKSRGLVKNPLSYKSIIIKTTSPLSKKELETLYKSKVDSIVYAGELSYYIYGKTSSIDTLIANKPSKIISQAQMKDEYKISNTLRYHVETLLENDLLDLDVLFFKEFSEDELNEYFGDLDLDVKSVTEDLRSAKIQISLNEFNKLKSFQAIQYLDLGVREFSISGKKTRNLQTAKKLKVSTLWGEGYNLSGKSVKVGIVDGGQILSSHQELIGRVHTEASGSALSRHATHVAGTIGAIGVNAEAKGMAGSAQLYSYSFNDVAFSDSIVKMYNQRDILLSNHSYGYSTKTKLGEYDSEARSQDQIVSTNPYINVFQAAGNDGDDNTYPSFGFIKGPGNSKNIFTIGALSSSSGSVATLSSRGPARDGRIKPDLVARGESVKSSDSSEDNAYVWMSGTSMAAPAATGAAALVIEQYKKSTNGDNIRHDTLKSLLINTAVDKANTGPDYKAGFGMINAKDAVDTLMSLESSNPLIIEGSTTNGGVQSHSFTLKSSQNFKTTISWVDPAANPGSAKALVNDIDIWLQNKITGQIYYPYSLSKDSPNSLATTTRHNRVDNIEQIEVKNLPEGEYDFFIKGHKIVQGNSQEYAIVSNIDIFNANSDFIQKESLVRNFARVMYLNN